MYKKQEKRSFKLFTDNYKNGKIGKLILMYGVEQYLVKWAVDTLVKKYVNPATKSMDYIVLDDENSTTDGVIEACETFSMFSEKKVVWVRNFKPLLSDSPRGFTKAGVESLCEYLESSNDGTIVIFSNEEVSEKTKLFKALKENGQVYNFDTIDRGELLSFARKRFKSAGVEISGGNLALLIDASGYLNRESDYRLFNFENDINKIIAHSDGVKITERDIEESVKGDMDTFVFDMLDGISGNQKDKALAILYNMLHSGTDAFSIIASIVSQFEIMLAVKQLKDDGNDLKSIHKALGGSEYRIKKMMPYTNRFSTDKLKEILSSIYEVDRNIKTGLLTDQLALEIFIAKI